MADRFEKGTYIGHGTFGIVHKATEKSTGRAVALKKVRVGEKDKEKPDEGISVTALREIKLLKELHHTNIIDLVDVYVEETKSVTLVFEYAETDLERVIKNESVVLSPADIKAYMQMLFEGLAHCHKNWILHRDLKPNNLLITPDGVLKLADFGLARMFGSPSRRFTHTVVTIWYRAPELLFGATQYTTAIDMWACGCIFAELMLRKPYLPGESDIDQLGKIFAALGTPTEEIWPGMTSLPDYIAFTPCPATPFKHLFTAAGDEAIDLLASLLRFNPLSRISAADALSHPYFSVSPAPTPSDRLVVPKRT